jgi:hypothetical protein
MEFKAEITIGDCLTALSMLVSLGVFCWQLWKSRKDHREDTRSRWFLDVVVMPNLESISKLYDDATKKADEFVVLLNGMFTNNKGVKDIHRELAKKQRELKDLVKVTYDHFQAVVGATEKEVSKKLNKKVDELVDILTNYVDAYEKYEDGTSIKEKVLKNHQDILAILYNGLNK